MGARRVVFTGGDPLLRSDIGDLEEHASRMWNRLFYNVFQAFPRAMSDVDWEDLEALLGRTDFDAPKHALHSKGWSKNAGGT